MNYALDTNVVIYAQKGSLAQPLPYGRYFVSVITEIELLSFPSISPSQEAVLRDLLNDMVIVGLDSEVKSRAIELRREFHLRIPDAIIAATASVLNAQLLTNDEGLRRVAGLNCLAVGLKEEIRDSRGPSS